MNRKHRVLKHPDTGRNLLPVGRRTKQGLYVLALPAVLLWTLCLFSGCGFIIEIPVEPTATQAVLTGEPEKTLAPSAAPTAEITAEPALPQTTEPPTAEPDPTATPEPGKAALAAVIKLTDAELYLEAAKYLEYYREIALSSEYGTGVQQVRKWDYEPVLYIYPSEDAEKYAGFIREHIDSLCSLPGFPGFKYTEDPEAATLKLNFVTAHEMNELTRGYGERAYGLTTVTWLNHNCHIIRGEIYIVREADCTSDDVKHAILEEMTQAMGLLNDSYEYTDSIFYQGYSRTGELNYIDWLMLRLHYAVEIKAGMEYDEVLRVVGAPPDTDGIRPGR